jgi:Fic family protein
MNAASFVQGYPGSLVRTVGDQWAYVPNPLPPSFEWPRPLIAALSVADRAVGRLSALGSGDATGLNPQIFIRPFLRREAVLSSRIEGTKATLSQLFLFEDSPDAVEAETPDVREVANYVRALEFGREAIRQRPLGLSLIRELHLALMEGVRGGDKLPGAFRREQVFIGSSHRIENARFLPPPPAQVESLMAELERYLQAPSDLPPLVRIALVHYQFEAIHPFRDGNGRIGRLLITLMLCADGLLPVPTLYLSAYLERYRSDYYALLLDVSQRGAWTDWLEFVLNGITSEAQDAIARAGRLLALRSAYHARVERARSSVMTVKLIDALFSDPVITTGRTSALLDLRPASAQVHIDRLIAGGILREVTGGRRNRVYAAEEVIRLLEEETE